MQNQNTQFLMQLGEALKKAEVRLEGAYTSRSYEEFRKIKKFILEIQQKIKEIADGI